jgi:membrane protease YdiL (CAAX protease family)
MGLQLLKNAGIGRQLFALLLIIFGVGLFISLFGILVSAAFVDGSIFSRVESMGQLQQPGDLSLMKFLQISTQFGFFILPAMVFGFLMDNSIMNFFKLKNFPPILISLVAILLIYISNPLNDWLVYQNNLIKLPTALSGIEEWMRQAESQAAEMTNIFLKMDNWSDYVVNLLMIGVFAAVGEELLLRGVLQPLFIKVFKNSHLGIWLTAFVFSFIHFQFYGFFARLFLGAVLGYFFYYTNNLWIPILSHFFNNAAAVTYVFISGTPLYSTNLDGSNAETPNSLYALISFLLVVLGIWWLSRYHKKSHLSSR